MEDFIEKKQQIVDTFNQYIMQEISKEEFIQKVSEFSKDVELGQIQLFNSIFQEILTSIDELTLKEIKQRKLMIESFIY